MRNIKTGNKHMQDVPAFAIIARRHLATFDHRLPVFWSREVAVEECEKQNNGRALYQVVEVKIVAKDGEL